MKHITLCLSFDDKCDRQAGGWMDKRADDTNLRLVFYCSQQNIHVYNV